MSENDDLSLIELNGYNCVSQEKSCRRQEVFIIYVYSKLKN